MLDREEYVEQVHLFRALEERGRQNVVIQDLLLSVKEELLATTKLPLAIDFLVGELKLVGMMGSAMKRLPHYFTPFQTFVVQEAEHESGRFDFFLAMEILRREAEFRSAGATRQGVFLFELECLCRNRLRYDYGLDAIAADPLFDEAWSTWIVTVRRQMGLVDLADLIYVRSEYFAAEQRQLSQPQPEVPMLFGAKEGRIARANRRKDPLFLFAALQRQLGYPPVPRPHTLDDTPQQIPQLLRRVERLEQRLKLVEEDQKGGFDLTKFYVHPNRPAESGSE